MDFVGLLALYFEHGHVTPVEPGTPTGGPVREARIVHRRPTFADGDQISRFDQQIVKRPWSR